MYTTWYESISKRMRANGTTRTLRIVDKALVYAFAAAYVAAAIWLAATQDGRLVRFLCVPAAALVLSTVLRAAINAPRPYERFAIDPILDGRTYGKSLPSRHTASAFAIAFSFLWVNPIAGAVACIASVGVACTRILGGVHFPRDIAAAIALAAVCAAIGFIVIP